LQGHILNTAGDALTVPCWFWGEITKREREREERVCMGMQEHEMNEKKVGG
jgi:hypothetical protein